MFSKVATNFDKIFTVDLTLCSKYQINGEDFVNFCGLFRKDELYGSESDFWIFVNTILQKKSSGRGSNGYQNHAFFMRMHAL